MKLYPQVKLDPDTELDEIEAVWQGDIIGEFYADGETWASVASLDAWTVSKQIIGEL